MAERVRKAIREANIKFGEKIRNGDAAGVAALYTEDSVLLPPNSEKFYGKKGIEKFWGGAISQLGLKDAILSTDELLGVVMSLPK